MGMVICFSLSSLAHQWFVFQIETFIFQCASKVWISNFIFHYMLFQPYISWYLTYFKYILIFNFSFFNTRTPLYIAWYSPWYKILVAATSDCWRAESLKCYWKWRFFGYSQNRNIRCFLFERMVRDWRRTCRSRHLNVFVCELWQTPFVYPLLPYNRVFQRYSPSCFSVWIQLQRKFNKFVLIWKKDYTLTNIIGKLNVAFAYWVGPVPFTGGLLWPVRQIKFYVWPFIFHVWLF